MIMVRVFVDTGIFVSVLNREARYEYAAKFLKKVANREIDAFISVVTLSEILSIYSRINEKEAVAAKTYIESIFGEDRILPILKDTAEIAGKIKAKNKMSLGDSFIVASAIEIGCDYVVSLDSEIKNQNMIKTKTPDAL